MKYRGIAIDGVRVEGNTLSFETRAPLRGNVSLLPFLAAAAGRATEQSSGYDYASEEGEDLIRIRHTGLWKLPETLSQEHVVSAHRQLQARIIGGKSRLTVNQRSRMFSVTNASGGLIHGELLLREVEPETDETASTVEIYENSSTILNDGVTFRFTARIPDGYRLVAMAEPPMDLAGNVEFDFARKGRFPAGVVSWRWGSDWSEDEHASAIVQLNRIARQPLRVEFGKPRTAFSVTNSNGGIWRGAFELKGAETRTLFSATVESGEVAPDEEFFSIKMDRLFARGSLLTLGTDTFIPIDVKLETILVRPDGRRIVQPFGYGYVGYRDVSASGGKQFKMGFSGSWRLPPNIGKECVSSVKGQIESQFTKENLRIPLGRKVPFFSVTNRVGGVMRGELRMRRTEPEGDVAARTVEIRKHSATSMKDGVMFYFFANTPPGTRLIIRAEPLQDIPTNAAFSYNENGDSFNGTAIWKWQGGLTETDIARAIVQLNRFDSESPLKLGPGSSVDAFSITNSKGATFRGVFELLQTGPDERAVPE